MKATVHHVLLRRFHKASLKTSLALFYCGNLRTLVKADDVMEVLRNAIQINVNRTGIEASEVSAGSLRDGGGMTLLQVRVGLSNIRMMGG
jgi:hypothetical protein